jgi:hypothetical protein
MRNREGRCSNQVAGVRSFITGDETFIDTGIHGPDGGAGLVCKIFEVSLEEAFAEVLARYLAKISSRNSGGN